MDFIADAAMRAKLTRRHVGRMAHLRLVLLLALLVSSCGVTPKLGEFGNCANEADDDNDGLKNCRDPDCFSDPVCRLRNDSGVGGSSAMDSGTPPVRDAGKPDTGVSDGGKHDAGTPDAGKLDAGSIAPPLDAAMIDDDGGGAPMCSPTCTETEECVLAMDAGSPHCQPIAAKASGTFTLTIVHVDAPDNDIANRCLDEDCQPQGFGVCLPLCHVDPYVRAVLVHAGTETTVATTTPASNMVSVDFLDGPSMPFSLAAGDVLRFDVLDSNRTPGTDLVLFDCKPDLSVIPGMIGCTTFKGLGGIVPVDVTATLDMAP